MRHFPLTVTACLVALPSLSSPSSLGADEGLRLSLPREHTSASLQGPLAVALSDLDGDGALDAAVVLEALNGYACLRGDLTGSFSGEIARGALYLQPQDLVIADFDGDGVSDIAGINKACSG